MKQPKWFQQKLFSWYKVNGRKNLPWQHNINAYRVWVSEIMLQQTQVATVIPYFEKFMRHFPNIFVLTKASLDEVLNFWAGLGYYSRAKNLHRTAQIITEQYQGNFPSLFEELEKLPGIGKSTAGAILAFAYHKRAPILDGNVKRVLVRFHAIQTQLNHSKTLKQLWELSERYTPKKNIEHYTQAIMDLGSLVCTRTKPQCDKCPLHEACLAFLNHLQNQLPIKNNPLKISSKEIKMLILQNHQGEVLLIKRPPIGIWGGLWSFPETSQEDFENYCSQELGCKIQKYQLWNPRIHRLTHLHLKIKPILAQIEPAPDYFMENSQIIWHNPDQELLVGVPKPVQKILLDLQQSVKMSRKL